MANNYIAVSQNVGRHASSLVAVINNLASQKDVLLLLKADMDQMINGADYTVLESTFGLPTGKGQTAYNLIAGAASELNGATNLNLALAYFGATR